MPDIIKSRDQVNRRNIDLLDGTYAELGATISQNITTKFRDAFESYTPGTVYTESKTSNDLIYVDGNSAASSYLVISKDPLTAGSESSITTISTFGMPVELAAGLSMSQRTLGQEFSLEVVDTGALIPAIADLAISSITQSTTVLTVDTVLPHGLSVGMAIGVYGCSNQLANYPALVVATVTSPTQFTATAGPGGTIPSQTITNPAGAKGFVFSRARLGLGRNGVSQIFENATVTNASLYIRSEAGDALPSGTVVGNHSATVGTTASVQLSGNVPYTYSFTPTTEYRVFVQADRTQWADSAVDAVAQTTSRLLRTQVCPDPTETYKLRVRANNAKSLTVPNAQIVSAAKTGTTTATVVTATAHGLVTGDSIVAYGPRDQTNFANLTTATAVTVVDATTFTIVWGAAVTATTYGGYVAKVQGGNLMSALGAVSQTAQSAALSTLADGTRQLVLVGSAAWAAPATTIGDLLEVVGARDNTTGTTSLGIDGPWKIANVATTTLTLVLPYSGQRSLPADFTTTNCGGGLIRRTDLRISFLRLFAYQRERVEMLARPAGDISASAPVVIQGGTLPAVTTVGTVTTVTTVSTVTTVGSVTAANLNIPGTIADVASAAIATTTTTAAFTPTFGISYEVNIPVTAATGTTPTLDVSIEESDDAGTNWYKVYDFPRITANGIYRSPTIQLTGNRVRYVQTVGGTTPSFTRAINRLQSSYPAQPVRQLIDRTVSLTTLNATTPSLTTADCGNRVQMVVNVGAITTTAPQLQLEGSDDNGVSWYSIGSPLTAVASSTVQLTVTDINSQLNRARVSTAGVGVTAGYVMIKAHD